MQLKIKNGTITGFKDEIEDIKSALNLDEISTKRVSHIYPVNPFLKVVFIFLRSIFSDNGKVAEWTRNWKCFWTIYIPKRGYYGVFKNRAEAIKVEKELIWQSMKNKIE